MKSYIIGNAAVVKSEYTHAQLLTIAKYRPDALVVKGGESGKDEIFSIAPAKDRVGSLSKFGACFADQGCDAPAAITITYDGPACKEKFADEYGAALRYIAQIEEGLDTAMDEIESEKAEVLESIEVIGE